MSWGSWRRPGRASFTVRKTSGEVVVIARERALARQDRAARAGAPGTRKALGGGDLAVRRAVVPVRAGPLTRPACPAGQAGHDRQI